MFAHLFVALLAFPQQPAPKEGDLLVYHCHNLSVATVRVLAKGVEVTTESGKATLTETSQPSARYSNGSVTLSSLDESIRIDEPRGVQYWCKSIPAEAPWEEARIRGIDFRAAGENPAWSLEIDAGTSIEFAGDAAGTREAVKFPSVQRTGTDQKMTWITKSGSRTLSVVAERRVCQYGSSTMTLAVTATLDGKTYRGCGRALTTIK